jgi:folate-binding protein YgfZ
MNDIPYSTISVSGDDAFEFLQAQLAADLSDLPDSGLAAWCNPKGRVICLFRVRKSEAGFELTLPSELADAVVKRLTMFRFRSKVQFDVCATGTEALGIAGGYEDWRLDNLRAGVAEILAAQSEEFTPHMLNLDLLGAVSVSKGCYPGQEIVARTHFRGATKRRMLRFESTAPVAPGDKVTLQGRDVGEVMNAIGNDLLAVVPVANASDELTVNSIQLVNLPLPYLE